MLFTMKKSLLVAGLLLAANLSYGAPGHIADDVYVFVHGGPSNQYRITGRVRSGTPIEILGHSPDKSFVRIRYNGKTGWADANNVASGDSVSARMPKLEKQLSESETLISNQSSEIETLRSELSGYKSENQTYTDQLDSLKAEIKQLNNTIDNMDQTNLMRWFTYGGMVALGGVLLGLIIPYLPKKKKRRDDWF
jgi:SH3 domain protein